MVLFDSCVIRELSLHGGVDVRIRAAEGLRNSSASRFPRIEELDRPSYVNPFRQGRDLLGPVDHGPGGQFLDRPGQEVRAQSVRDVGTVDDGTDPTDPRHMSDDGPGRLALTRHRDYVDLPMTGADTLDCRPVGGFVDGARQMLGMCRLRRTAHGVQRSAAQAQIAQGGRSFGTACRSATAEAVTGQAVRDEGGDVRQLVSLIAAER